jgi:hypothetical protein
LDCIRAQAFHFSLDGGKELLGRCFVLKGPEATATFKSRDADLPKALAFDCHWPESGERYSRHAILCITIVILIKSFVQQVSSSESAAAKRLLRMLAFLPAGKIDQ